MNRQKLTNETVAEKNGQQLKEKASQRGAKLGSLKLEDSFQQLGAESSPKSLVSIFTTPEFSKHIHVSQISNIISNLQQTYGNTYLQRMIQAKLKIGRPSDIYEQDAERVADAVIHMPQSYLCSQVPQMKKQSILGHGKNSKRKLQINNLKDAHSPYDTIVQSRWPWEPLVGPIFSIYPVQTRGLKIPPGVPNTQIIAIAHEIKSNRTYELYRYKNNTLVLYDPIGGFVNFVRSDPLRGLILAGVADLGQKARGHLVGSRPRKKATPSKNDGIKLILPKAIQDKMPKVTPELESKISALQGGGQPIESATRAYFELRFGFDLSQVRIHKDSKAGQLVCEVNALAFTVGKNIVFGDGQYAPGTTEGKKLLAHELTHVVQQSCTDNSCNPRIQKKEDTPGIRSYKIDDIDKYLYRFRDFILKKIDELGEFSSKKIEELPWKEWILEFSNTLSLGVDKLTEKEKQSKFKIDVNATVAILLYEFATGTGEEKRIFGPSHDITEKIAKGNAVKQALDKFYEDNKGKNIDKLEKVIFKFKFSPNSKGEELFNIPKSLFEHLEAAREIIIDEKWSTLFIGGADLIVKPGKVNNLQITLINRTSKSSLMLHVVKDVKRKGGEETVFGTITQEFNFTVPLEPERLKMEDDKGIIEQTKEKISEYMNWFYEEFNEELIRRSVR